MKIVVLHGQHHKGSTYHIAQIIMEEMQNEPCDISEFFFDQQKYCKGCFNCILRGEQYCPNHEQISPVTKAMDEADVIIMASPCYCIGATGQLKSFLDHLAYMWMPHRPRKSMFSKIGLVISTAAGAGSKNVTKELARHLFYLGVGKVYQYPFNVGASSWEQVSDKNKCKIRADAKVLESKITKQIGHVKPNIKMRAIFFMFHKMQQSNDWNKVDAKYWEDAGWTGKIRPWKH